MPNQNKTITKNRTRLIFMGTPDFAVPGLGAIIKDDRFDILGVFTQPDKPAGRGHKMHISPVKKLALDNSLAIFQPDKIKQSVDIIKTLEPDLIVVIAYGQIIPQNILDIPTYGCINVHASLLPKYRGAACLNAPILNGDTQTGVTIMKMDAGLDTGPILRQAKIDLTGKENLNDVHDFLSELGAKILTQTLIDFINGEIEPQDQDDSQASYVRLVKKADGRIDWSRPVRDIDRIIRGYNPWPGTFTKLNGQDLKIISAEPETTVGKNRQVGELFLDKGLPAVQTGQGILVITRLQLAGRKALSGKEFVSGYKKFIGSILS